MTGVQTCALPICFPVTIKKGKTKFGVPVFEIGQEVTEAEDKALRQLTDEYDNYLKYYHSKKEETVAVNTTDEDDFTN